MKSTPLFVKKSDLLLVAVLLLIALLLWGIFRGSNGTQAVIRINGEVAQTVSLQSEGETAFENNGYHVTVAIEKGMIQVSESDCPDGICQNTGSIHRAGETIVCLPAALSITIEGEDAEVDGVTF